MTVCFFDLNMKEEDLPAFHCCCRTGHADPAAAELAAPKKTAPKKAERNKRGGGQKDKEDWKLPISEQQNTVQWAIEQRMKNCDKEFKSQDPFDRSMEDAFSF